MRELDISRMYEYESGVSLDFATFKSDSRKLEYLDTSWNTFTNYEIIGSCYRLKVLKMQACGLEELRFLKELTQLEELDLAYNEDIKNDYEYHFLCRLQKLKKLNLSFGCVTDRSLVLKGICLFKFFPKLEYLAIRDNLIRSDAFLAQLPKTIKEVSCRANYFSNYEENYPAIIFNEQTLL